MGPVYDQPRAELTREQVDASLRYQIMEVVDQIRWIPGFGYERELDWLINMRDWMISKKRYWGLALPIYDCHVVWDASTSSAVARTCASGPSRAGTSSRATRRTARSSTRSTSPARRAASRSRASPTSATRGSTPASSRSRRSTSARIPTTGRSGIRPTSSPRASRASSATGSTRCWRWAPCSAASRRSGRSSATPRCSPRTAGRCTRAGATRSTSTRQPSGWASTSCAGCSRPPDPRTTSASAGMPRTPRAASCSCCGTSTRSS